MKKRFDEVKEAWTDELNSVLRSYQITLPSTTGKIPFKLTYRVDAMIPVEVEEPIPWVIFLAMSSQAF